jgi:ribosomal protein L24
MRVRKDDDVIVIGGKDRGKRGRVIRTDPKKSYVFELELRKAELL